jgi:RNA 2',3'-cyclic 3'-phosphodiesterase
VKNRRLFFALWPTDAVRAQLAAAAEAHAGLGRAIGARNLHVTVVFLGAVPAERLDHVVEIARSTQKLTLDGKFMLHLDRLEFWRRSSLVALTATQVPPELLKIVDGLRAGLRERGFQLQEHDMFRPHVTLVRDVARGPAAAAVTPVQWPVESFALVESQVGQRGSQYSVLDEWSLA